MKKLLLLSIVLLSLLVTQLSVLAQPRLISFQGNILDQQDKPYQGPVQMTFELFDRENGGTQLWSEIQNVSLNNGYFNVYLGSVTPFAPDFNFNRELWMQITVGNGTPYPRTTLSMVPASFFAQKSGFATISDSASHLTLKAVKLENLADDVLNIGGDLYGTLPNPKLRPGAVLENIENGSITQDKLSPNVTTRPSGPASGDLTGFYPDPLIAVGAVKTDRIFDGAVTTEKLADFAITYNKLQNADGPVGTMLSWDGTKWVESSVPVWEKGRVAAVSGIDGLYANTTTDQDGFLSINVGLLTNGVTTSKIADDAVTYSKFQNAAGAKGTILNWDGTNWVETTVPALEHDGVIGNEILDVIAGRGLMRSGLGTEADPYKVGIAPSGVINDMIANQAVTLNKFANGTQGGQMIWWDAVTSAWKYSGGAVPAADQIIRWTNTGTGFEPRWSNDDAIVGNEVLNATTGRGLIRAGAGTTADPYTLGIDVNGVKNDMIAATAVSYDKLQNAKGPVGTILGWDGTKWVETNVPAWEVGRVIDVMEGEGIKLDKTLDPNNFVKVTVNVANDGITTKKIADKAVTYPKLQDANGAAGTILSWNGFQWTEYTVPSLEKGKQLGVTAGDAAYVKNTYDAQNFITTEVGVKDLGITTAKIADGAVDVKKLAPGTSIGQMLWWEQPAKTWRLSKGPDPKDTYVMKWFNNGTTIEPQWAKDALTIPYLYDGEARDDNGNSVTMFSMTKTDDGTTIMAIAGNGSAIEAGNNSMGIPSLYVHNDAGAGSFAIQANGDVQINGDLYANDINANNLNANVGNFQSLNVAGNITTGGLFIGKLNHNIINGAGIAAFNFDNTADKTVAVNYDATLNIDGTNKLGLDLNHSNTWLADQSFNGNLKVNGNIFADDADVTVNDNLIVTGNVNAVKGTFTGDVNGANGIFTGNVSGVNGAFTGNVSGVNATFTGTETVNGAFLNLSNTTEFRMNGVAGAAGRFLVSRGAGLSPNWTNTIPNLVVDDLTVNNNAYVAKNVTVDGTLDVAKDVMLNTDGGTYTTTVNNLDVTKGAIVGEDLAVAGDFLAMSNATIGGNIDMMGNASIVGTLDVWGHIVNSNGTSITIDENVMVNGNIEATGNGKFGNGLNVTGNGVFSGNISGVNANFTGTLNANGPATLGSTLGVTGAATLNSNLEVKGTYVKLAANTEFRAWDPVLNVNNFAGDAGDFLVSRGPGYSPVWTDEVSDLTILGLLTVKDLKVTHDADITNDLFVHRNTTLDKDLAVNGSLNVGLDAAIGNDLIVSHNTIVGNDVDVVNGSLTVHAGNITATLGNVSGVNVIASNNVTATNNVSAGKDVTAGQDVKATRDVTAGHDVKATNDLTAGNNLAVTGTATIGGNLTANSRVIMSFSNAANLAAMVTAINAGKTVINYQTSNAAEAYLVGALPAGTTGQIIYIINATSVGPLTVGTLLNPVNVLQGQMIALICTGSTNWIPMAN